MTRSQRFWKRVARYALRRVGSTAPSTYVINYGPTTANGGTITMTPPNSTWGTL